MLFWEAKSVCPIGSSLSLLQEGEGSIMTRAFLLAVSQYLEGKVSLPLWIEGVEQTGGIVGAIWWENKRKSNKRLLSPSSARGASSANLVGCQVLGSHI